MNLYVDTLFLLPYSCGCFFNFFSCFLFDLYVKYPSNVQDRIFKDIRKALEEYPYLVAEQSEMVLSNHGNIEKALSLCGPVAVNHRNVMFFVPIDVFIPTMYPAIPPICYVRPAKGITYNYIFFFRVLVYNVERY